jgi:hypothetical protein
MSEHRIELDCIELQHLASFVRETTEEGLFADEDGPLVDALGKLSAALENPADTRAKLEHGAVRALEEIMADLADVPFPISGDARDEIRAQVRRRLRDQGSTWSKRMGLGVRGFRKGKAP